MGILLPLESSVHPLQARFVRRREHGPPGAPEEALADRGTLAAVRILVYEHVTGGGYAGAPLPLEMAAQGYAMVIAALGAFASVPGHRVVVLHDARIPADALPAHTHFPVGPMQWRTRLLEAIDDVQAVLVIAPETGGVLADLTAEVEARTAVCTR